MKSQTQETIQLIEEGIYNYDRAASTILKEFAQILIVLKDRIEELERYKHKSIKK